MYTKLFPGVWNGSLRGKADPQLVFLYLLGNADQDGFAEMIQQKIADDTGLPLERVEAAISLLEAEDPLSRTPDEGGRRITPIDGRGWGWHITNYLKYRNMRDEDRRREQNRDAQRRHRLSASVSIGQQCQPRSAQAEAEAEAEKPTPLPDASSGGSVGKASLNGESKAESQERKDWRESFDVHFWPTYQPLRRGRENPKGDALAKWMTLKKPSDKVFNQLMDELEACMAEWAKKDNEFVPHATTWLNKRIKGGVFYPSEAGNGEHP